MDETKVVQRVAEIAEELGRMEPGDRRLEALRAELEALTSILPGVEPQDPAIDDEIDARFDNVPV